MKIGVISDTHIPTKVKQLPAKLIENLQGVDLIIHAGDIVDQETLLRLQDIAPVKAVAGNIDQPVLQRLLPERLKLKLAGYKIGITHGHNLKGHIMVKLAYTFPEADIIIFGHTHRPCNQTINGQLYFNPGSPTDRRLQPHHTFGIIELNNGIESHIINL